ncbi:hypothetical protein HWV62_20638 [Athelia sp. TMB]|nr:hypothetical protein HWV62_20638 [Athelia sp. TMB]
MDASDNLFVAIEALIHEFCNTHYLPFDRVLKAFTSRHAFRVPGDNMWNTYAALHTHPDHTARELARVGLTLEQFNQQDKAEQQRTRASCWGAFQKAFDTEGECRVTLELFKEVVGIEQRGKGTTIAKREKAFKAMTAKVARIAEAACFKNKFDYWFVACGRHIHSDSSLVDIRMSDGMQGFTERFFKADMDKMKGHALTYCFNDQADKIAERDWADEADPTVTPKGNDAHGDMSSSSSSSSISLPSDLENVKPAQLARILIRNGFVGAGGKLDTMSSPWLTLPQLSANCGIRVVNWPPDCPFPCETTGKKGVECLTATELAALIAQFRDAKFPLVFQLVVKEEDKQALRDSTAPVIITAPFGKPTENRRLYCDRTVKPSPKIKTRTLPQADAFEPLPSSELTELDETDCTPSASPQKPQLPEPAVSKASMKKDSTSAKRTRYAASPNEESDRSPAKRTKNPTSPSPGSRSDSSVEVSEINAQPVPAPKPRAVAAKKAAVSKATSSRTRSKSKSQKIKSEEFVLESDGEITLQKADVPATRTNSSKTATAHPKPQPGPSAISSTLAPPSTPSSSQAPLSTEAPPTDVLSPPQRGSKEVHAATKVHQAPGRRDKSASAETRPSPVQPQSPVGLAESHPAPQVAAPTQVPAAEGYQHRLRTPASSVQAHYTPSSDFSPPPPHTIHPLQSADMGTLDPPVRASSSNSSTSMCNRLAAGTRTTHTRSEASSDEIMGAPSSLASSRELPPPPPPSPRVRYNRGVHERRVFQGARYDGHPYEDYYHDERYGYRGMPPHASRSVYTSGARSEYIDPFNHRYAPPQRHAPHSRMPPPYLDYGHYEERIPRYIRDAHSREPSPPMHRSDLYRQPSPSPYMVYRDPRYAPSTPPPHRHSRHPDAATPSDSAASPQPFAINVIGGLAKSGFGWGYILDDRSFSGLVSNIETDSEDRETIYNLLPRVLRVRILSCAIMTARPSPPSGMLPTPSTSVLHLLQFSLSPLGLTVHDSSLLSSDLTSVFVQTAPTCTSPETIALIEVPAPPLLEALELAWENAIAAGARAVKVAHTVRERNKTLAPLNCVC